MDRLIDAEEYMHFRDAATRAQELAMAHGESAWVRRADIGWRVAVPPVIAELLAGDGSVEEAQPEDEDPYPYDDYQAEIQAELMDEIEEDRENWARSDEEGWFYGDD